MLQYKQIVNMQSYAMRQYLHPSRFPVIYTFVTLHAFSL